MRRLKPLLNKTPVTLGVIASLIAIGGATVAVVHAVTPGNSQSQLSDKRQLVAFRQVANHICTENRQALHRALLEARSNIELLAYLARGTNWGVGDLSGVTPPASVAGTYPAEVAVRRHIANALLNLQHAVETGDQTARTAAEIELAEGEAEAGELSRSLGLPRCKRVLPSGWRA